MTLSPWWCFDKEWWHNIVPFGKCQGFVQPLPELINDLIRPYYVQKRKALAVYPLSSLLQPYSLFPLFILCLLLSSAVNVRRQLLQTKI